MKTLKAYVLFNYSTGRVLGLYVSRVGAVRAKARLASPSVSQRYYNGEQTKPNHPYDYLAILRMPIKGLKVRDCKMWRSNLHLVAIHDEGF